jgi:hypothetical protein
VARSGRCGLGSADEFGIKFGFWFNAWDKILKSNKLICHSSSGGQKQGCFCHDRIEDALDSDWW